LPAMGCAAALTRLRQPYRIRRSATAARQIVSKLDSYGLRPEAKATGNAAHWTFAHIRFWPEAVGAWLAGDGVRSSPKITAPQLRQTNRIRRLATAARQIVGRLDSHGLWPELTAESTPRPISPARLILSVRAFFWMSGKGRFGIEQISGDGGSALRFHAKHFAGDAVGVDKGP